MQLEGKVAIVTGGSRGIGKAIATVFARGQGKPGAANQGKPGTETSNPFLPQHISEIEVFVRGFGPLVSADTLSGIEVSVPGLGPPGLGPLVWGLWFGASGLGLSWFGASVTLCGWRNI